MQVLSVTTIYPNESTKSEGRSVYFLDQALSKLGTAGQTLVLKPWAPRWLARRIPHLQHLAVAPRQVQHAGFHVNFSNYLHLPGRLPLLHRYRFWFNAMQMASQALRVIERHNLQFDIVHGQSIYPAALVAHIIASRRKVPFVITLRDHLCHLDALFARADRALRFRYRKMFEQVDAVFVHGPSLLADVQKIIPAEKKVPIHMATNGVDFEGIDRILSSLQSNNHRFDGQIVSVGNLFRFKGIHENLHALKRLQDKNIRAWHYTIVGDGPYRKELEKLTVALGLQEKVSFKGKQPFEKTIRLISEADIFSLPSWEEPFGNVYAEAAMCRKPAIGCLGQGAAVTILHEVSGLLVPPRNVEATADALEYLLTHPEQARQMGQNARRHVQQFTWERTATIYQDVMTGVLSHHSWAEGQALSHG